MSSRAVCVLVLIFVFAFLSLSLAQQPSGQQATNPSVQIKKTPAPYSNPTSGKAMYGAYCAACHGANGSGNGPAAAAFRTPPTNLTTLAAKNNGEFPTAQVSNVIMGDTSLAAHGSKDMPVWGPVFRSLSQRDQAQVLLRVHNLTDYIKQIQGK